MTGKCEICGRWMPLEKHHVFHGPFRKKADKLGLTINLCHWCHNEPPMGVHFDQRLDNELKARYQLKVMEEQGWTVKDFIREFGRNYL